MKADKQKVAT
jgi:ABC-type lipoprotein export system ATPase subunit